MRTKPDNRKYLRYITAALLLQIGLLPLQLLASPLPSDSRITTGTLKNGVKWMYRNHDNPPGKMALMMHVDTGSLNETDAQQGLAHFIEHMCFNGSENFKPGDLIPYFESIGMEFGGDVNAFTSFDQTAYMLFLPDTTDTQIDKALMVMSDYAFRVSFLKEEIEKERGVVLEESRSGKSAFQRIRDKLWPKLYKGSRFAKRLPIGIEHILETATRKDFVDYYNAWYRPENITIMLVGDRPADGIGNMIEKWFGDHKTVVQARTEKTAEFTPFTKRRAMVVTDPEMAFCQIQMTNIKPGRPPTTTTQQWRDDLIENVGSWIIGRRHDDRVQSGKASYHHAGAGVANFFNDAIQVSSQANGEPEDWNKMLEEIVMEIHRVRQFGFTAHELDLAKKELLAEAKHAVKTEPTRSARGMVMEMVFATNNKEPIMSAEQELKLYEQDLSDITLEEINEAFRNNFEPGTFSYVITMAEKDNIAIPTSEDVMAAASAAWARKVMPLEQSETPTQILATLPTPGTIVEQSMDKDLGITNAWLSNGVRVHHRFMDYKKDAVTVTISLAGGGIEETAKNSGISQMASLAISSAATNRLSSSQLRDLMTGKSVSVHPSGDDDTFGMMVSGSPKDLEVGLQAAYALLTDGKIEESAFNNFKLQFIQQLAMIDKMPRIRGFVATQELLSGDDPRRSLPTKEHVESLNLQDSQAWFDRLCQKAPLEVSIVGEIKLDEAMNLAKRYLGSLPKRERHAHYLDKLRTFARPTGPLSRHVDVETVTPQAMAMAGFVGADGGAVTDRRALQLASNILSSRLVKRVREELSIVYSIGARNQSNWSYKDSGVFGAGAPCDPENVNKVVDEVHTLFKAFAADGPTSEELENAKKQIDNNLETQMREPRFWTRLLSSFDLHHRNLDEAKSARNTYANMSSEQVQRVFKKYYKPTRQFSVTAVPVKPQTSDDAKSKKGDKAPAS